MIRFAQGEIRGKGQVATPTEQFARDQDFIGLIPKIGQALGDGLWFPPSSP